MKEIADIIDKGESEKKIMLYEEVEKYARLSGDKNAWDTSGSRIGGYLDGYDKGIEILDRVRAEIAELSHYYPMGHDYQIAITRCLAVIDKYKPESENK